MVSLIRIVLPLSKPIEMAVLSNNLDFLDRLPFERTFYLISDQKRDNSLPLRTLLRDRGEVIEAEPCRGDLCQCLYAIDWIDREDALLIATGGAKIDFDPAPAIEAFQKLDVDAGVFSRMDSALAESPSIRLGEHGQIQEMIEGGNRGADSAIGLYYFRRGRDFVRAAMKAIRKEAHVDGRFPISTSINELSLEGKSVIAHSVTAQPFQLKPIAGGHHAN